MRVGNITYEDDALILPATSIITDSSRDMSVTVQVPLTGAGFRPRLVFAVGYEPGSPGGGTWGMSGGTGVTTAATIRDRTAISADTWAAEGYLVYIQDGASGSNWFGGSLASLDTDGFTIDYVANGASAGNVNFRFLCIK